MDMVIEFHKIVGMKFRARLSFRDPKQPEEYLGDSSLWDYAQDDIESIAKNGGFEILHS